MFISYLFADGAINIDTPTALIGLGSLIGGIVFMFRALISAKDQIIATANALIAEREKAFAVALAEKDRIIHEYAGINKTCMDIAQDAFSSATESANFIRKDKGQEPLVFQLPVVANSQSPPTERQLESARIETMKAGMVLIRKELGQNEQKVDAA